MRIARLRSDLARGAQLTFPELVRGESFDLDGFLSQFSDGRSVAASWRAPTVVPLREDDEKALLDCVALAFVPAFSARAVECLRDLLEQAGELLPLDCAVGDFAALKVLRFIPALDFAHSDVRWLPTRSGAETKRVIEGVKRWAFDEKLVQNESLFKLPEFPLTHVFATEEFIARVEQSGLAGFRFDILSPESTSDDEKARWRRRRESRRK